MQANVHGRVTMYCSVWLLILSILGAAKPKWILMQVMVNNTDISAVGKFRRSY